MTTTTITARQVKQGDWIVYDRGAGIDNPRAERVVRVTTGPRGYVHIRTNHCDRTVKVATEIERVTCTVGPSAVTGKRCGQPAVKVYKLAGMWIAECAEHAAPRTIAAQEGEERTYSVTFAPGYTFTRTTRTAYAWASIRRSGSSFLPSTVSFHTTRKAAARKAGPYGAIEAVIEV